MSPRCHPSVMLGGSDPGGTPASQRTQLPRIFMPRHCDTHQVCVGEDSELSLFSLQCSPIGCHLSGSIGNGSQVFVRIFLLFVKYGNV